MIIVYPRRGSVLNNENTDIIVVGTLTHLLGNCKISKQDAETAIADAFIIASKTVTHAQHGIRPDENIVDYLCRVRSFSGFSAALPEMAWLKPAFAFVDAREKYESSAPPAQQRDDKEFLPTIAYAIDRLNKTTSDDLGMLLLAKQSQPLDTGLHEDEEESISDQDDNHRNDRERVKKRGKGKVVDRPVAPVKTVSRRTVQNQDGDVEMMDGA
ncbi:hypothetical protein B0T17DRAFT_508479 [Bombardia bombarda]|uniref:Uncharacterized protein n=1 Tax=Bombardia bombarda TaxID=252184 RepID=A0AA40C5Y1_9PEZI|nr:hypothetical protein B0T17DRAFT_508479 [Bombardia bombarda]